MDVGAEECFDAADNRDTGRVDRADGGRDPGLAVGEGVLNEAVRGAGVDGVGGHDIGFIGEAGAGGRGSERGGVGGGGGEE